MSGSLAPSAAVADRLAAASILWLSTLRRDGSPHLVPVWFAHVDDRWWIGTSPDTVKVANCRRDPRVSVALEDGSYPVVAEGRATVHADGFPEQVVAAFVDRYSWEVGPPSVLIEVATTRWLMAAVPE